MLLHDNAIDMSSTALPDDYRSSLVSAARTSVGDELRSVTYFDRESVDQLYLRDDLNRSADLVGFAEQERTGFSSREAYRETELGEYRFTIRVFEHGYLTRVLSDSHGVWVTTDGMRIGRFEELAEAVARVLRTF